MGLPYHCLSCTCMTNYRVKQLLKAGTLTTPAVGRLEMDPVWELKVVPWPANEYHIIPQNY